jgi:hypothetical protein
MKTQKPNRKMRRATLQANDASRLGDTVYFTQPVTLAAASGDGATAKPPSFEANVYSGGMMTPSVDGGPLTVVVDLAGMAMPEGPIPVLRDHDPGRVVGHAQARLMDGKIVASGVISGTGADAAEVVGNAKNGFPWQLSMGAAIGRREYIAAGAAATINGRAFSGPFVAVRAGRLKEISFLSLGADESTSARIAASQQQGVLMNFEQWLKALGFALADLSEAQKTSLKAKYDAEMALQAKAAEAGIGNGTTAEKKPDDAGKLAASTTAATNVSAAGNVATTDDVNGLKAQLAEMDRVSKIGDVFRQQASRTEGECDRREVGCLESSVRVQAR